MGFLQQKDGWRESIKETGILFYTKIITIIHYLFYQ
jgi:hypothetical protein